MKQVKKPKRQNKNLDYSKELQDVFDYMCQVLAIEFPVEMLTPEYLVLSMLDRETHALLILQTQLNKKSITKLRESYADSIRQHSNKKVISGVLDSKGLTVYTFNDECTRVLSKAQDEANKCFASAIYTEHVILALLNEGYGFADRAILNEIGLNYDDIFNKCVSGSDEKEPPRKVQNEASIPIKSGVGKTMVSSSTEYIKQYTINLNEDFKEHPHDALIGRTKEMNEIITVLARREKNNCIIVGNGGCGKTTLVNGLVDKINNKQVPSFLNDKIILKLDVMSLVGGTTLRGMLEERISGLSKELRNTTKYILFVDDIQQVIGESGSSDNDNNLSNMLNELLETPNVKVIGTTNFKTYKKHIEPNPSMQRKFQRILLEDTNEQETIDIITKAKERYEQHHNVFYPEKVVSRCVTLSKRYITTRSLPDSAFDVLDTLGAKAQITQQESKELTQWQDELNCLLSQKDEEINKGNFEFADSIRDKERSLKAKIADFKRKNNHNGAKEITLEELNDCISEISGVPVKNLDSKDKKSIRNIDSNLQDIVIGQDEAVSEVARVMKRNSVGLGDKRKVMGTFLFYGSTGVGKTLLAKELAKQVFGSEDNLVRIDMSEYSEKSSMSKLIGTTAGYIGYDNGGGVLTEAIKKHPYSVILFDEVEKADPEIYNLFLQLFDEGRLTDGSGTLVNFKNTIIIMTSNIGVKKAQELGGGIGFNYNAEENRKSIVEKTIKQKFSPEFLNRIDKLVYFNTLKEKDLKKIIDLELKKLQRRIKEIGYTMTWNDDVVAYIYKKIDKAQNFGARPIGRIIQSCIEDEITDLILDNDYQGGHQFEITIEEGKLYIV